MPRQPAVLFPDVAEVVIGALRAALAERDDTTHIGSEVPADRTSSTTFATVNVHGGARRDLVVDRVQLGIEAWAATDVEAHDLAQLLRALLATLTGTNPGGVQIYRVEEAARPVPLPDPLSDQPRYVFDVVVHVRGRALT